MEKATLLDQIVQATTFLTWWSCLHVQYLPKSSMVKSKHKHHDPRQEHETLRLKHSFVPSVRRTVLKATTSITEQSTKTHSSSSSRFLLLSTLASHWRSSWTTLLFIKPWEWRMLTSGWISRPSTISHTVLTSMGSKVSFQWSNKNTKSLSLRHWWKEREWTLCHSFEWLSRWLTRRRQRIVWDMVWNVFKHNLLS